METSGESIEVGEIITECARSVMRDAKAVVVVIKGIKWLFVSNVRTRVASTVYRLGVF